MLAKYIETKTSIVSRDLEVNNCSEFSNIKTKFCRDIFQLVVNLIHKLAKYFNIEI